MTIRGIREGEAAFQVLPVPEHLWEGVDTRDFIAAQVPGLFVKQSVGARLFIDAIIEDRAVVPSFYDGYKVQEVVDAALRSQETQCWVSVAQEA